MSRHVSDERLDTIHAQFAGAIRQKGDVWVEAGGEPVAPGHDLICLLDELRMRRGVRSRASSQWGLGKTAKILIALKVGERVEIEPVTKGALTTARATARKHLGEPDAVWWSRTLDNGLVEILRAPDGSPPHAKYHNPAVYVMAAMRVSETQVLTTLAGKMHNAIKIHARRIADLSEADWRCENLANGHVRVTRVR